MKTHARVSSRYAGLVAASLAVIVSSIEAQGTAEDYVRAERFRNIASEKLVLNFEVRPHWTGERDSFWYRRETGEGATFVLVDPAIAGKGGSTGVQVLEQSPEEPARRPERSDHGETSPDGRWTALVRENDLYLRSMDTGAELRLTEDGAPDYAYAVQPDTRLTAISERVEGDVAPLDILWSPNSKRLVTYRTDQRGVRQLHVLEPSPGDSWGGVPVLHSPRVPVPGDEVVTRAELFVFDEDSHGKVRIEAPPLLALYPPIEIGLVWWSADGERVYFIEEERGYRAMTLHVADATTGRTRKILEERGRTYVQPSANRYPPEVRVLGRGAEVLWYSERDGWGHLYLFDGHNGALKAQVTRGEWVVHRIHHVDEASRWVYFSAGGREVGRDPYYAHLYRARLDGSRLELLTPEPADHEVVFSPSGSYFLDTYSTVATAPVTVLRRADGRLVRELERADISALAATGWRRPERFRVKARDGRTDLYGVLYLPSTMDPQRTYPILDDVYGGPQSVHAPRRFSLGASHARATAELGFVVIRMDGMGTPLRGKAFHDVSYGEGFGETGGLQDHVTAIRQLAAERPYMDMSRVGIYGHSGGGYAAARAILMYPDFFKVAVASSGSHDQRLYIARWGERYIGMPRDEPDAYRLQANSELAHNLRGKLLLIHGSIDDDVHSANTLQLVQALIRANKDFELLILPKRAHEMGDDPYFIRRRWDYLVRHLWGVEPRAGYNAA